jgi:hypothetical protein
METNAGNASLVKDLPMQNHTSGVKLLDVQHL